MAWYANLVLKTHFLTHQNLCRVLAVTQPSQATTKPCQDKLLAIHVYSTLQQRQCLRAHREQHLCTTSNACSISLNYIEFITMLRFRTISLTFADEDTHVSRASQATTRSIALACSVRMHLISKTLALKSATCAQRAKTQPLPQARAAATVCV